MSTRKEEFLKVLEIGRKTGCDVDGDVINGKYHHLMNEAREFGISFYYIINGKEREAIVPDKILENYIKNDILATEKLAEEMSPIQLVHECIKIKEGKDVDGDAITSLYQNQMARTDISPDLVDISRSDVDLMFRQLNQK